MCTNEFELYEFQQLFITVNYRNFKKAIINFESYVQDNEILVIYPSVTHILLIENDS